ncbi:MAG: rhodanese-like domain-containing protein [Caldilineaceae bacterium]
MPNPYGAPEISAGALKAKRDAGEALTWLDVREPWEVRRVQVKDEGILNTPLSDLSQRGLDALPDQALDKQAAIVVQCHHGVRSAQVALWLRQQGWSDVVSLAGGVDAWAKEVDASIGTY